MTTRQLSPHEHLAQVEAAAVLRSFVEKTGGRPLHCADLLQRSLADLLLRARRDERLTCSWELEELGHSSAAMALRDRWAETLYP